ncbi:MAG: hypothetical protein ACI9W6_000837 [Motiliproteus sp.]|jgi:hypothetical protein
MKMHRFLVAGLLGLSLTACQAVKPQFQEEGTLNSEQLYTLFANKTVESNNLSNNKISYTFYTDDGQVIQQRDDKVRTGQWKINSKGKICLNMENKGFGCRYVVRKGEEYLKYRKNKEGKFEPIIRYGTFVPGKIF